MSETTHHQLNLESHNLDQRSLERHQWLLGGLSVWLVSGLIMDGWAHRHVPRLETFLTPWHGVFYSGFLSLTVLLVTVAVRPARKGLSLTPVGYEWTIAGTGLFWFGAVGDYGWHELFGIEKSVEALLSPTHLLLALGMGLMVSGPLRAALKTTLKTAPESHRANLPALLSLTLLLVLTNFFTQFAQPITSIWVFTDSLRPELPMDFKQELGVSALLLFNGLNLGAILLAITRLKVPFGGLTLLLTSSSFALAVLSDQYPLVLAGTLAGLLADVLIAGKRWELRRLQAIGFWVPALHTALLEVILKVQGRLDWVIHLWAGSIIMSGLLGFLLTQLISPTCNTRSISKEHTITVSGDHP
jgi:hypothetical protein